MKAALGSSTLTLALRIKTAFTAIDVLVLIGLKKTAALGYTAFCLGIKVNDFAMIWIQNNCFNWLL